MGDRVGKWKWRRLDLHALLLCESMTMLDLETPGDRRFQLDREHLHYSRARIASMMDILFDMSLL